MSDKAKDDGVENPGLRNFLKKAALLAGGSVIGGVATTTVMDAQPIPSPTLDNALGLDPECKQQAIQWVSDKVADGTIDELDGIISEFWKKHSEFLVKSGKSDTGQGGIPNLASIFAGMVGGAAAALAAEGPVTRIYKELSPPAQDDVQNVALASLVGITVGTTARDAVVSASQPSPINFQQEMQKEEQQARGKIEKKIQDNELKISDPRSVILAYLEEYSAGALKWMQEFRDHKEGRRVDRNRAGLKGALTWTGAALLAYGGVSALARHLNRDDDGPSR
ncbi:MAG: hypothetical protein EBR02_06025 [Alphaproteobacteria bacterium]|nr:hypothetical protein [Alphaproteobacteria bacterium]